MTAFEAAFRAGWSGDFTRHDSVSGLDSAEAALLRAQRWMAEPAHGEPPLPPERAATRTEVRQALLAGRAAWLGRDLPLLRRCAAAAGGHPEGELLEAWVHWASGRFDLSVQASESAARGGLDAPARVDAVVVRSLAHLEAGRPHDAVSLARRAIRMARTEEFPQAQYAAGLCLSRVRRASGAVYLAMRILAALRRAASPPWREAIAWEEAACGVVHPDVPVGEWLSAAEAGDALRFDAIDRGIASSSAAWEPYAHDLAAWRALLDPEANVPAGVAAFLEGRHDEPPSRLLGLLSAGPASDPGSVLFRLDPDGTYRRVARRSEALVAARAADRETTLAPGRTGLALSALGLAGGTLPRPRFFERVYGFAYEHRVHRGTLKALVHRVRAWLGERGTVALDDEGVTLSLSRPLMIVDPRGEDSLERRMLRYLASAGARSARETAGALNVPLRSVQRTLSQLVEDGSLASERAGRGVAYHVEDTAFSLPTRWR